MPNKVLNTYWGYPKFREGQREAIDGFLKGQDGLVILPTTLFCGTRKGKSKYRLSNLIGIQNSIPSALVHLRINFDLSYNPET